MHTSNSPPVPSEKAPGPRSLAHRLRTVLLLAFGGLLALMIAAGVSALFSLRRLHVLEQQVSNRFVSHTRALSEVVISVHIYNDQLAKFLLADQPAGSHDAGAQIAEGAAMVHSAIQSYPSDGGPQESRLLQKIEKSLSEQEGISSALLSLAPEDRKTRAPGFVHEQLLPSSLTILEVSQQIAYLNGEELAKSNQDLLTKFASLQARLKSMILAALAAGLLLSLLGTFYVLRLERQGRERESAHTEQRSGEEVGRHRSRVRYTPPRFRAVRP